MDNNRSVEELIGTLYDMVQDAWNVPMSGNKCVLERDQVQSLLDEISAKVEPLAAEKRALESELKTLQAVPESTPTKRVLQLVDTFEEVLATGDCYAIHDAVAELIDYIEIDGDKIYIHWNF